MLLFFVGCDSNINPKEHKERSSYYENFDQQKRNVNTCFGLFPFHKVQEIYQANNVTSGRMNTPLFLCETINDTNQLFGYYNIIDKSIKSGSPLVAKFFVSFPTLPWTYNDSSQKIISILVLNEKFAVDIVPFDIGDKIEIIDNFYSKYKIIDDIILFENGEYYLAVESHNDTVRGYLLWCYCNDTFNNEIDYSAVVDIFK